MIPLFKSIMITSICGSVFILLLLVLKPVTKKLFSPHWQYYIWLTVLVILISPVSIKLPIKIMEMENAEIVQMQPESNQIIQTTNTVNQTEMNEGIEKEQIPWKQAANISVKNMNIISSIWFMGIILCFSTRVIKYIVFQRTIRKNSCISSYYEVKGKQIQIRKTDMLGTPLLIGLLKPVLFVPQITLTEEQMNYILLHEMMHYKRHDILFKWFALVVNAIHWFNPLVYIVIKQMDEECEISCDICVTSNMNVQEQKGYMNTILTLLSAQNTKSISLTTQMSNDKTKIVQRFNMIKNIKKKNKMITGLSCIVALLLFLGVFVSGGILNSSKVSFFDADLQKDISSADTLYANKISFLFSGTDNNNYIDSLIVITADKSNKAITALTIPRDTLLIRENENYKLSSFFLRGGSEEDLVDTMQYELGIPIDYYVEMNLKGFKNIIDALDGVEYDVPFDMNYSDVYQDLHIELKKGLQVLDGDKAEQLFRFRQYPQGEIGRIEIQLDFLKELVKQKLNIENISKLSNVKDSISQNVKTNYPIQNIIHDSKFFEITDLKEINTYVLPGNTETREQVMYYVPDKDSLQNIVDEYFIGDENKNE